MNESLHEIHQSRIERLEIVFFWLLAIFCFCLGVYYWVRLIGVFEDENWRFDLMSWAWRCLSSSLAVFYPVAACGLWLQSRWGVVLWLAGGLAETVCYLLLSGLFVLVLWLPLLHLAFLIAYLFIVWQQQRQADETNKSAASNLHE